MPAPTTYSVGTRSDLLLLVLGVVLSEDPTGVRGPRLERLMRTLAQQGIGSEDFSGARTRRALLEGLAHLEQNDLIKMAPSGLTITDRGRDKLRSLTERQGIVEIEGSIRKTAESVLARAS